MMVLVLKSAIFVTPNLRTRLGYSSLSYEHKRTLGSINFVETFDQSNARLTLDWFPWKPSNGLFASVGLVNLGDSAKLSATVDSSLNYTLGGVLYSGTQLGKITGSVETESNLPYVGVGYKYDFGSKESHGAFIQAEVGVVHGLDTKLKLTSTNPNNISSLSANLQTYASQQNDKFEDSYTLYGLTIGYRF